jgi:Fic family protein
MDYQKLTAKKQELDKFRPLDANLVRNLEEWFKVELTYSSNAIEGNTLSRKETALVVEKGLTIGGKTLIEHLEATNHASAIDFIYEKLNNSSDKITQKDILKIHEIILSNINKQEAGFYRSVSVRISGSCVVFPNARKIPDLMNEFCRYLLGEHKIHPIEFAAEAHYRLVTIHPFIDGNGRCARLLMNMILMMNGYPPAIIRARDRLKYISSLEKPQLVSNMSNMSEDNMTRDNIAINIAKKDYFELIAESVDRSLEIYLQAVKS